MKTLSTLTLLALTASGTASAAVTMNAPDSLQIQSATVHYDAAAIQDRRSAKKLFFEIRMAAEEVCRLSSAPRGHEIWAERDCEAAAVAEAVNAADIAALDEYYYRGSGDVMVSRR